MTTRRDALSGMLGASALAIPLVGLIGSCTTAPTKKLSFEPGRRRPVVAGTFMRAPVSKNSSAFPAGVYTLEAGAVGYEDDEWFIEGVDEYGQPYRTQVVVWQPKDKARFSGTVIVEPLHAQGVPSIFMSIANYITRSGHGWACVASQKVPVDFRVKPRDPDFYSSLHIAAAPGTRQLEEPSDDDAVLAPVNQASDIILAQTGAALLEKGGPFQGKVAGLLLAGHSQTGGVVTRYVLGGHERYCLANGAPIYRGFFPAGSPRAAFPPRNVPLIQVLSEGDVFDEEARFPDGGHGRRYRRSDSDDPRDLFRLYELAGTAHASTRYPPYNDPARWKAMLRQTDGVIMNSMPKNELLAMAMHHLVRWVSEGVRPPKASRMELARDGRYFAKDAHGNALGGVRSVQLDVPRATYFSTPLNSDGTPRREVVGFEAPFSPAKMRRLYGSPSEYSRRFSKRLAELIADGWLLPEDAPQMREEAHAQKF